VARQGENFYRVKELAKDHRDVVIAKRLSLSRERVRQLRLRSTIEKPYDSRQCTKCGEWFKPIKKSRSSKFRSTCGCIAYNK